MVTDVDGHKVEVFWRAHQVPMGGMHSNAQHREMLEEWMESYKPEELLDDHGKLIPELKELAPKGDRRMSANPITNGGLLRKDLLMPDFRDYEVEIPQPGTVEVENTRIMGIFLRIDRYNLVIDVIDRVEKLGSKAVYVRERMRNEIIDNLTYAHEQGIDKPEVVNWKWPY